MAPHDSQVAETYLNHQPSPASAKRPPIGLPLALATLSGALAYLASAFPWAAALGWLALLPLLWVMDHAATLRRALCWAFWAGWIANLGTTQWLPGLLAHYLEVPWPAALAIHGVFAAYQALVWLILALIVRTGRRQLRLPMVVLVPAALVAAEVCVPFLFPFGLEMSQAGFPAALQIAELAGRFGVTALLGLGSAALYELAWPRRPNRPVHRAFAAGALLLIAAALLFGALRLRTVDREVRSAPTISIGVVQPNTVVDAPGLPLPDNRRPLPPSVRLAMLHARSAEIARDGAQLVLWPENSYPGLYPRERTQDFPATDPLSAGGGLGRPLIAGSLSENASDLAEFNSALAFDADGHLVGRYDKLKLVAFGEYVPAWLDSAWVHRLALGDAPGLHPGQEARPIRVRSADGSRTWSVGMLICYEDILAALTRQLGSRHPDVLVDLSNDGWFESQQESWQHLAASVFVAVEQRTSLVRAVNPGGSALIDPAGRIRWRTPLRDPTDPAVHAQAWRVEVPLRSAGHTVYDAIGPVLPNLCVLFSTLILAAGCIAPLAARRRMKIQH